MNSSKPRISIFGLGYVGAVSAGCLANDGHHVTGVDPNETKVALINGGKTPIIEPDIGEMIETAVKNKRLVASSNAAEAIANSDVSMICVGTPSQENGSLNLDYIRRVCEQIGAALKTIDHYHVIVGRSTMLPGTMRTIVIPTLEKASGKKMGDDFGVCLNPEFLREGTAVYDYYHPPKTVIGESDKRSGDIVSAIYSDLPGPKIRTAVETAEMVKYTDNVWHAVKVTFGNEIGNICKALNIDSHEVMNIFCQDTKLNLSPYYLKPGFAFGGSCLPKDVRALSYKARSMDLDTPLISSLLPSNQLQVQKAINMITSKGKRRIGILGFSFKAGTDDLRESPVVDVIEHLIGKGYDLKLYDKNVNLAALVGANREYIHKHIPHIARLMVSSKTELLAHAETIVIGNGDAEFKNIIDESTEAQVIVDLVRIHDGLSDQDKYDGICW